MIVNVNLDGSTVSAELHAFVYAYLFGYDGVLKHGGMMQHSIISNNEIQISDGMLMNQGRILTIPKGSTESLTIENGQSGVKRKDLIVAHFEKSGGHETHDIRVLKGNPNGTAPEPTKGDTLNGATINELPLYEVVLDGINITSVNPQFKYIFRMDEVVDALVAIAQSIPLFETNNAQELLSKLTR